MLKRLRYTKCTLIILFVLIGMLSGCDSKSGSNILEPGSETTNSVNGGVAPGKDSVSVESGQITDVSTSTNFFTGPVKLSETVEHIEGMEDREVTGEIAKSFDEQVTYEVTTISWNEDGSGAAQVRVTVPALESIITEAVEMAVSGGNLEDYNALLATARKKAQEIIESPNCPTVSETIGMEVKKTDDGYSLVSNEAFEKAISGHAGAIFVEKVMEGMENAETE